MQFLLAFIVDIALFAFVKQQVDTLHNGNTVPGPGKILSSCFCNNARL
jgi:hypothetical protein